MVSSKNSSKHAMKLLAEDAVNRAINYFEERETKPENGKISISEAVLLGESKRRSSFSLSSGFEIIYENGSYREKWNTADLYEKIGVVLGAERSETYPEYYKKKGPESESRPSKYGYRRILKSENWENLKKYYKSETFDGLSDHIKFTDNIPNYGYSYILNSNNIYSLSSELFSKMRENDLVGSPEGSITRSMKDLEETIVAELGKLKGSLDNRLSQQYQKILEGGIWFRVIEPVVSFTGRETELHNLHSALIHNVEKKVLVSGLGGIGKTELARKYAHNNKDYYNNNIIWIDAETHESCKKAFYELASQLGIAQSTTENERRIRDVVNEVYRLFSQTKSLFIFDGAEHYNTVDGKPGIGEFLSPILAPGENKPHFLITSNNNRDWPANIHNIELGELTRKEAMEFISSALDLDNSPIQGVELLANKLGYFPLALQQATAYINSKDKALKYAGSRFTINNYLNEYEREVVNLLSFVTPNNDRYTRTVLTTLYLEKSI